MRIYDIPEALADAIAKAVDPDTGEIVSPELLESVQMDAKAKIIACAMYCANLGSDIDEIDSAIQLLKHRRETRVNAVKRLREMMLPAINAIGGSAKTALISVRTARSQSVSVDSVDALPSEFRRVKVEADKAAIKAALKSGTSIPGCSLVESESVVIRRN